MKRFKYPDKIEIGIDEAGRGCMAGPVYAAAVIWPTDPELDSFMIKDSKKISKKKREIIAPYIETHAVAFGVGSCSAEEIDKHNILEATYMAMHRAVDNLLDTKKETNKDILLVDGKWFKPYWNKEGTVIEHECIEKGDAHFTSIAAASILAKVYHDRHIKKICTEFPQYSELYQWEKNMCYGTAVHMNAIRENGITEFHRKTCGICARSKMLHI